MFAFLRGLRPDDFALRAEILDPDVRRCINRSVHERACQVPGGFIKGKKEKKEVNVKSQPKRDYIGWESRAQRGAFPC